MHSGFGGQEDDRGSTQEDNRRTNSAGDQQAVEAGMGSTSVGATGSSKLRESRHHLPTDEKTYQNCRGEGPVHGSRHGEDS